MKDKLLRDLLLGFVKVHILHHADKEPIFGQEFHEELKRHGYDLSFGTLYPIFHKLEAEGYLKSKKENINGKVRRYYSITASGKKLLEKAKLQANELVKELYED